MQLGGARALLTGASGGLGRAIAGALHARGAHVLLSGRRADALEEVAAQLGGNAEVLVADLSDAGAGAALAERAGAVDVLVSNAGLPASGPLDDFSRDQIDRAIDVNLRAPMQLARALVPGMAGRGRGHVVLMSSLSGKTGSAGSSVYSATKFGLRGFAAGLRADLHASGVGVTVIFPSFVRGAGMFADSGVQLPRWVGTRRPEDVARAVVHGIESGKPELDVAPLSLKLGVRAAAVAPGVAATIQRRLGSRGISEAFTRAQRAKR
jgi:short-subunit dehydrogenase